MSWGKILLVSYLLFIGGMLFMVVKSFQNDYDLVVEDYYADELKFQDQIDATNNAAIYKDSIALHAAATSLQLKFPVVFNTATSGEVYFYKASNAADDVKQPLKLDVNGMQLFDRTHFKAGFYTVKIKWKKDNIIYYTEKNIRL